MTTREDFTQSTVSGEDEIRAEQKRKAEISATCTFEGIRLCSSMPEMQGAPRPSLLAELKQSRPAVDRSPPPMVS